MPGWLLISAAVVYLCASVVAFVAYWIDKRAAVRGAWRTPERRLHLIELLGGWPGALVAQRVLRHKTRDAGFRAVFFAIVAAHGLGWAAGLWIAYGR